MASKQKTDEQAEQPAEPETLPGTEPEVDPNVYVDATANEVASSSEGDEPEPLKARRGHKLLRYIGSADVVMHGEIRFRPGEWVEVPTSEIEELLTLPNEEFEVTMEAEGDDG